MKPIAKDNPSDSERSQILQSDISENFLSQSSCPERLPISLSTIQFPIANKTQSVKPPRKNKSETRTDADRSHNVFSARNKISKKLYDELLLFVILLKIGCEIRVKRPKRNSKTTPFLMIEEVKYQNILLFNKSEYFIQCSESSKKKHKEEIMARTMNLLFEEINHFNIKVDNKQYTEGNNQKLVMTKPLIVKQITIGEISFDHNEIKEIGKQLKEVLIDPLIQDHNNTASKEKEFQFTPLDLYQLHDLEDKYSELKKYINVIQTHFDVISGTNDITMVIHNIYMKYKNQFISEEEELIRSNQMNQTPLVPKTKSNLSSSTISETQPFQPFQMNNNLMNSYMLIHQNYTPTTYMVSENVDPNYYLGDACYPDQ